MIALQADPGAAETDPEVQPTDRDGEPRIQPEGAVRDLEPRETALDPVDRAFHRSHVDALGGWEGLIAKNAASPYVGGRSPHGLEFKCHGEQEFVVAGFTDPEADEDWIGALVLGIYEKGDLVHAGRVGTGFDDDERGDLRRCLARSERRSPPFPAEVPHPSEVPWTTPRMVVQVAFTGWTRKGRLRHPRYLGIRHDKDPTAVHREG